MDSTQQIGFQVTLSHFLNAGVGMSSGPSLKRNIELQRSMRRRAVGSFANVPKQQLSAAIMSYREANSVAGAIFRKPGALCGIAKIAVFVQILIGRFSALVTRSGAVPLPAATQGQARRMLPAGVIEFAARHKEWAGHVCFP